MTEEPAVEHPDNLFRPVAALYRTLGRFDRRARAHVRAFDATHVRAGLTPITIGLGAVLILFAVLA